MPKRVTALPQDLVLLPVPIEIWERLIGAPFLLADGDPVPHRLTELVAPASQGTVIAYIAAEFSGGVGKQAAAVWIDEDLVDANTGERPNAINAALRTMGVAAAEPRDEFGTVGLGRHRTTASWIISGD